MRTEVLKARMLSLRQLEPARVQVMARNEVREIGEDRTDRARRLAPHRGAKDIVVEADRLTSSRC